MEDAAEGWGSIGGSRVPIEPRGMAMLGKWGDPVSVQGVRGASSHIRTLNKSHGFSGARRPGREVPTGSQVRVVVAKVSGLSCESGLGDIWGHFAVISLLGYRCGI